MADTEEKHWWFVGRRAIIQNEITRLRLPSSAEILEAGAGTGGNLSMLRRHGAVSAMELDSYARQVARNRSGLDILEGALPDRIPFVNERFDLICLFDVLEHVGADIDSLAALAVLLKPSGRVMITVPAYPWMWSEHDVVLHHCRRYTRGSLTGVIQKAGLHVEKLVNFNAILFPAAVAARGLNVLLGRADSPGTNLPPAAINNALGHLFSAERYLVQYGGFPFGLSLLAVCRMR